MPPAIPRPPLHRPVLPRVQSASVAQLLLGGPGVICWPGARAPVHAVVAATRWRAGVRRGVLESPCVPPSLDEAVDELELQPMGTRKKRAASQRIGSAYREILDGRKLRAS